MKKTIIVSALCSLAMIFQVFDTINYWFHSRYQSKVTSVTHFIGYAVVAAYKIYLLATKKSVEWFAISTSLDYIIVAILNLLIFKKYNGSKFAFSIKKAKYLFSKSYNYILSCMMVAAVMHGLYVKINKST